MNVLDRLHSFGVDVTLTHDGTLDLQGGENLSDEDWNQVVDFAKKFKAWIISEIEGTAPTAPAAPTRKNHITPSMLESWKVARPWLLAHLPRLQAAGWTRAKLFRAGRLRFPCGPWGVAFLSVWTKDGVQVEIEDGGAIRWTWADATGKTITQAARPKH